MSSGPEWTLFVNVCSISGDRGTAPSSRCRCGCLLEHVAQLGAQQHLVVIGGATAPVIRACPPLDVVHVMPTIARHLSHRAACAHTQIAQEGFIGER